MATSTKLETAIKRLHITDADASMQPVSLLCPELEKKRPRYQLPKEWAYGLRIKMRDYHRICEEWNLPWEEDPFGCSTGILDWAIGCTDVPFKLRLAVYRGEPADIITFVVADDSNKDESLKRNKYSEEQMESVRQVLGIKHGPRWFELHGRNEEDDSDTLSIGDEEMPSMEFEHCIYDDDEFMEVVSDSHSDFASDTDNSSDVSV